MTDRNDTGLIVRVVSILAPELSDIETFARRYPEFDAAMAQARFDAESAIAVERAQTIIDVVRDHDLNADRDVVRVLRASNDALAISNQKFRDRERRISGQLERVNQ